jgi:hypothetical protein
MFIVGPAVAWTAVGFIEGRQGAPRRLGVLAAVLVLANAVF